MLKTSKVTRGTRSSIRRATHSDMEAIHKWLLDEESREIEDNFLFKWDVTQECFREGLVLVYVDGATQIPVAYQWGGLVRPGILQVRSDMRGRGIGKKLVNRCLIGCYKRDECLLYIQCAPSSSIPFWQKMGFIIHKSDRGNIYAHRILSKLLPVPPKGQYTNVAISFFPVSKTWDDDVNPYSAKIHTAILTSDGVAHLPERVFFFASLYEDKSRVVVEIRVGGKLSYCDMAHYDHARIVGIIPCANGYFIDRIQS